MHGCARRDAFGQDKPARSLRSWLKSTPTGDSIIPRAPAISRSTTLPKWCGWAATLLFTTPKAATTSPAAVLTQIIVEEEGKGQNLLPTNFLRQLIGLYGGSMQGLVPKYLEHAMTSFAQQQEQMRTAMQKTMGTLFPFGNIEEVGRQNMAMMERAFSLFTPFYRGAEPTNPSDEHGSEIEALRSEIERLRRELEIAKKK